MIAYKAFKPGLICLGFQFTMGLNVTAQANCRSNGFHCAENPLDCLTYYPNMDTAEYFIVKAEGDMNEDDIDTKIACTKLSMLKKLNKETFFLHGLAFMMDHPFRKWSSHVTKDRASAHSGYAVVRGLDPIACGEMGDVLAFAKEDLSGKVVQVALVCVDGVKVVPHVWYDANLAERQVGCFE